MPSSYRFLLYFLFSIFLFSNGAVAQGWEWVKRGSADGFVSGTAVAADRFGCIYSLMGINDTVVRFDSTEVLSNGCDAAILMRHDAAGNVKWTRAIRRNCKVGWYLGVVALATDKSGNVYVTGGYNSDSLLLESKSLVRDTSRDGSDMFVVKYDSTGNVIWAVASDAGGRSADPNSISVDPVGNVYVSGNYYKSGSLSFGGVVLNFNEDDGQMYLVKFDSTGKAVWGRKADYPAGPLSQCSAIDSKGNIYVAGDFRIPSLSFSGVTVLNTADTPNYWAQATDVFLAKFSPDNQVLWVRCAGSSYTTTTIPRTLTVDKDDNVLMAGISYSDSIEFDHQTVVINAPAGSSNMFLARYDSAGNVKWARGVTGENQPTGLATDDTGNIYVVGDYTMSVIFGSTLHNHGTGMSSRLMVIKYDTAGDIKWARSADGTSCQGWGITCDPLNNLYIIGGYRYNLQFDTLTLKRSVTGAAFLAKVNPYLHFIDVPDPVIPNPPPDPDVPLLLLYPNPAVDMITIAWNDMIRSVSITNVLGQRVINVDAQLKEVHIDIAGLASGVYYARINNKQVRAFVKKQKP